MGGDSPSRLVGWNRARSTSTTRKRVGQRLGKPTRLRVVLVLYRRMVPMETFTAGTVSILVCDSGLRDSVSGTAAGPGLRAGPRTGRPRSNRRSCLGSAIAVASQPEVQLAQFAEVILVARLARLQYALSDRRRSLCDLQAALAGNQTVGYAANRRSWV